MDIHTCTCISSSKPTSKCLASPQLCLAPIPLTRELLAPNMLTWCPQKVNIAHDNVHTVIITCAPHLSIQHVPPTTKPKNLIWTTFNTENCCWINTHNTYIYKYTQYIYMYMFWYMQNPITQVLFQSKVQQCIDNQSVCCICIHVQRCILWLYTMYVSSCNQNWLWIRNTDN